MILAIIQARSASARLPGKSMALLSGVPLVEHVVKRTHASILLNYVCVATTDTPADDALAAHVSTLHNTDVYRGSEQDVLARFYYAALGYPKASAVLRVTADDPFVDPTLIDMLLQGFLMEWGAPDQKLPLPHCMKLGGITWPEGIGFHVFTRQALETAHRYATTPYDREHVVPYIERELGCWTLKDDKQRKTTNTRWTIDTPEDLAFASSVYEKLYAGNPLFGLNDLVKAGY